MNTKKVILIFIKNKLKEIGTVLLYIIIGSLMLGALGVVAMLFMLALGCLFSVIFTGIFAEVLKSSEFKWFNAYMSCGYGSTVILCLLTLLVYGIIKFVPWFKNWIGDNWQKAIEEVRMYERVKSEDERMKRRAKRKK